MKWFIDGDQVCITKDDFENLQESPAVFVPADGDVGKIIQAQGLLALPFHEFLFIRDQLKAQTEEGE